MKLVKGIIAAALMTVASVGAASATSYYNYNSSLLLTAWNQVGSTISSQEIGMDLVDTSEFQFAVSDNYVKVDTIDPTLITSASYALKNLTVAIYGINQVGTLSTALTVQDDNVMGTVFFATTSPTAYTTTTTPAVTAGKPFNLFNLGTAVASYYKQLDIANDTVLDGDAVVGLKSSTANYDDASAKIAAASVSLASVGTSDVILYLYAADAAQTAYNYLNGGNPIAKIKIEADGDVLISTVPVPGAVWLLGSALLGAVGLRRKNA